MEGFDLNHSRTINGSEAIPRPLGLDVMGRVADWYLSALSAYSNKKLILGFDSHLNDPFFAIQEKTHQTKEKSCETYPANAYGISLRKEAR